MNGHCVRNELNAAFWSGGWLLGLAFLFSFFVTMLMLTLPMFMLLIYDRVLTSRSQESLVALFGLVVLLLVLMGLFDYSRRRILARFGARLQQRLEARVLEAVEARAPRGRNGCSISGTKELDGLRSFFHSGSLVAVFDFVWAPIFLGAVFLFHPLLGWVATTGVLVLFATAGLRAAFSRHLAEDAETASSQVGRVSRHVQDSRRTLAAQAMAAPMLEGWLAARKRSRDMAIVLNDRIGWFTTVMRQLRLLFQAMTLALGAYLILGGQLTVGGMVASVVLLGRVFRPVESLLANLPDVRRAASQWQSLDTILRSAPRRKGTEDIDGLRGGLEIRDLRIRHPDGKATLLEDVSFCVQPGEVVQITGSTGSGKSILARALVGQQAITSGTINLCGRNIEQFGAEEIGQLIGYLPEEIGFYPGTILDNITRFSPNPQKDDVVAAAKRAGAHRMIEAMPNGYATVLGADGAPLSRGQRQRIAMARALFGSPRVLVLDEPGSLVGPLMRPGGPAIVVLGRGLRDLSTGARHLRLESGTVVVAGPDQPISISTQRRTSLAPKIASA